MNDFNPQIIAALQNPQDHNLTSYAVGMIGDICRSINEQALPYCRDYMTYLVENLKSPVLDRQVKPSIISTFGDIAFAAGGEFESLLEPVMQIIEQAMQMTVLPPNQTRTYADIDYVNSLREGILEAYVGITQGLNSGQKVHLLSNYVERMFLFMESVENDEEHTESAVMSMAGLIGDISDSFPERHLQAIYSKPWVDKLLKELKLPYYRTKNYDLTRWVRSRVKRQIGNI
ncbi:karyopherin beta [Physocladia obscura]|uniref:Karyopherin beta n=1 Tax=Physocladia obscura TaxID=109957 RepID=A0AAD5STU2_9FUNG|nr:karyopherin beta [Physocladia obscura]